MLSKTLKSNNTGFKTLDSAEVVQNAELEKRKTNGHTQAIERSKVWPIGLCPSQDERSFEQFYFFENYYIIIKACLLHYKILTNKIEPDHEHYYIIIKACL